MTNFKHLNILIVVFELIKQSFKMNFFKFIKLRILDANCLILILCFFCISVALYHVQFRIKIEMEDIGLKKANKLVFSIKDRLLRERLILV